MIRILLVDDQILFCEILKNWLEKEQDFEVVGCTDNGLDAIKQVQILKPDIVLLDIHMPVMDGVNAAQIISERFPASKIIILSSEDNDAYLANALKAGAKGYLLKNTNAQDLVNTIRSTYKGYTQVSPELFDKLLYRVPVASLLDSEPNTKLPLPESQLQQVLKQFETVQLLEIVKRTLQKQTVSNVLTYLQNYLKTEPTNLAALYLSGVLNHQGKENRELAFDYLQFGFQEGIKEGLPKQKLLLFYREAVALEPENAYSWLTQNDSPWCQDIAFLRDEATLIFGKDSQTVKTLKILQQIEEIRLLKEVINTVMPKIFTLNQGFAKLEQSLFI